MGQIEWAMWANEQAIISAAAILIGGICGVAGDFNFSEAAIAALVVSVFILLLEWPRSKRVKGHTIQRRFQRWLVPVHTKLGFFTRNYFFRFVLHLLFSVPCCFLLPTFMGGLCLQAAAIIYLVAAIKKEEWRPTDIPKKEDSQAGTSREIHKPEAPSRLPPRNPAAQSEGEDFAEPSQVTLGV